MSYEFTGTVEVVEVKRSSKGKTYYRLNIPQNGSDRWHTSFDKKVIDLQGETINFNAVQTQYGWNLKEYEIAQPGATAQANVPAHSKGRSAQENIWIAVQGMILRGIEVGFFQSMTDALRWFNKAMPVLQAVWDGDSKTFNNLLNVLELEEIGATEMEPPPEEEN